MMPSIILGFGKMTSAGLIPMLSKTSEKIVVISSKNKLDYTTLNVTINSETTLDTYSILCMQDGENYTDFLKRLYESSFNVGIIMTTEPNLLKEIFSHSCYFFSCCRNGLIKYTEIINQINDKYTRLIIAFENNSTLIVQAEKLITNKNLKIRQGIVHKIVTKMEIKNDEIFVYTTDRGTFIYPPEAKEFEKQFKTSKIDIPFTIKFPQDILVFNYYCKLKSIDINCLHTIACIICYDYGLRKGKTLEEIATMTWDNVISLPELLQKLQVIHKILFYDMMSSYTNEEYKQIIKVCDDDIEYSKHYLIADLFFQFLYSKKDTIDRGLNFHKYDDMMYKISYHIGPLELILSKIKSNSILLVGTKKINITKEDILTIEHIINISHKLIS